jgi:hypothetical protein
MADSRICLGTELTNRVMPAQMSVPENDVSNESVMFQKRSRFWQEAMVNFQPFKNLKNGRSPHLFGL